MAMRWLVTLAVLAGCGGAGGGSPVSDAGAAVDVLALADVGATDRAPSAAPDTAAADVAPAVDAAVADIGGAPSTDSRWWPFTFTSGTNYVITAVSGNTDGCAMEAAERVGPFRLSVAFTPATMTFEMPPGRPTPLSMGGASGTYYAPLTYFGSGRQEGTVATLKGPDLYVAVARGVNNLPCLCWEQATSTLTLVGDDKFTLDVTVRRRDAYNCTTQQQQQIAAQAMCRWTWTVERAP